jgi:hypothetical protein
MDTLAASHGIGFPVSSSRGLCRHPGRRACGQSRHWFHRQQFGKASGVRSLFGGEQGRQIRHKHFAQAEPGDSIAIAGHRFCHRRPSEVDSENSSIVHAQPCGHFRHQHSQSCRHWVVAGSAGGTGAAAFAISIAHRATLGDWQTARKPDSSKKNDIRGAHTHIHKSGGRQPAVVR